MSRTSNPGLLTKNFSGNVFGAFATDLVQHIESGLSDEQCEANKIWLQEVAAAAAALPDGNIFGKKIYERCDAVFNEYDRWNSPKGTPDIRKKYHQRIKDKVNKLSTAYRRRTALLEKEADIKVYLAFYDATEKLVLALPNALEAVSKVLIKYPKNPATV